MLMALAAFAARRSYTFKGLDVLQMAASGIEAIKQLKGLSSCADNLRTIVRECPPSTYTSHSQRQCSHHRSRHSTRRRVSNAYHARAAIDGSHHSRRRGSRVSLRQFTLQAQEVHAAVMQSMPAMAAAEARSMWLGDIGAGMYCVINTSMAVAGNLRPNSTFIVSQSQWHRHAKIPLRRRPTVANGHRWSGAPATHRRARAQQRVAQPHELRMTDKTCKSRLHLFARRYFCPTATQSPY
eukprot:2235748-Pleurochrysis_carterae.AAC.2